VPEQLERSLARLGAAAQNAFEVARFGGLETGEDESPYEVVERRSVYRLRRYFPDAGGDRPPVLLVPPMMLATEVYDVSAQTSAVAQLHERGIDPWVVDFGAPEREEGGLERDLTDHVLAVDEAIERVRELTGRDVHLGGYSQGGMFCYQAAAYRRSAGIASLVACGSPVDTQGALPLGIPDELAEVAAAAIAGVLGRTAVPPWLSRTVFRLLDPAKATRQQLEFLRQLHDREALLPRERQRRFLMGEGWVAWPGPAVADFMRQFIAHNRMLQGGFVISGRLVTLADIALPVLIVVGTVDQIAPPAAVRAVTRAAPRAEVYELDLQAGHFGLVVGSQATATTWPTVAQWVRWREGEGPRPEGIVVAGESQAGELAQRDGLRAQLSMGAGILGGLGVEAGRSLLRAARSGAETAKLIAQEVGGQLPRLARLGRIRPDTRISMGLLLAEQARDRGEEVLLLFEDRAHTKAAVNGRIDNVVRGLLSLGVRQGEHVGVLMGPRPSGLSVVSALNRLGAVAVLMRPDGPVAREAELGRVKRIVADPELAGRAREAGVEQVLVLGGGGGERDLGPGVIDMEQIDPDAVEVPAWYVPNPGRAGDLAFLVFSGEGERTRVSRITNGRWALSAFGTASAAALTSADTVYAVTPIHHPSGLLMSIGGAIAGGARIALARRFDPETFWQEVRRYGATVSAYTWTMLHEIVTAPENPAERHHPLRLFIGAGMPRGLWRRVVERFAPARVLEFYASTEGEAILVNLSGEKAGCKGRPLPGSAEVRLAAYDAERGELRLGEDGFAIECERGEVGMLLTRLRGVVSISETPLRGLFEPGDAWLATGDLFRVDEDGDFWLVDHAPALIRTAHGYVASFPVEDALADADAIDLAVVYGVDAPEGGQLAVAAVTLREGFELDPVELVGALSVLPRDEWPDIVQVLDELPVTTWYRPNTAALRARGVPTGERVWRREGSRFVAAGRVRAEAGAA